MSFSEFLAPHADVLILGLQPCDKVVTLAISRIFLVLREERHFSSWPPLLGAAAIGRGFDFQFWTITQGPAQGLKITEKCTYVQKCTQRRKRWVWQKFVGGLMRLARTFARGLAKIQLLKLHVDHYCFFLLFELSTKIWNFTCLNFAGIFIRGRLISHMKWKSMGTWHLHMKSRNSESGWYAPFRLRSFRKYVLWFEAMQFFYPI